MAGPSTHPPASAPERKKVFAPHPDDEVKLRAAFEEAEREPGRALTEDELRLWIETGEWPES